VFNLGGLGSILYAVEISVATPHKGAPGQMTWLEDLSSALAPPCLGLLLCFGNSVNGK